MPISRKKSCVQCRASKARCSLGRTCNRCIDRGLRCDYGDTRLSPYPSRQYGDGSHGLGQRNPRNPGDAPELEGETGMVVSPECFMEAEIGDDHVPNPTPEGDSDSTANIVRNLIATPILNMPDWSEDYWNDGATSTLTGHAGIWQDNMLPTPSTERVNKQSQTNVFGFLPVEDPKDSGDQAQRIFSHRPYNVSAVADHSENEQLRQLFQYTNTVYFKSSDRDVSIFGKRFLNLLSQRTKRTPQSFLMSRVLLGQIVNYPKMLSRAQLPPFIYPTCVFNNLDGSCTRDGTHTCLREPLAICQSLVRMFYGGTPQSSAFIWKTIFAEQQRLYEEHRTFDSETLLAAVQSMLLYILLQAQDTASIQQNDVKLTVTVLSELIQKLHGAVNYQSDIYQMLTQREWVLNESMRRAGNLIFVLESLLDMMVGRRDIPDCPGFGAVPVPCPRDLWECHSSEAWSYRLRRYLDGRTSERILKIRDIQQAQRPRGEEDTRERETASAAEVAKWCESVDDFGTLVWMATLLD